MTTCPACEEGILEEHQAYNYTGIIASDGYKENGWETWVECVNCKAKFSIYDSNKMKETN